MESASFSFGERVRFYRERAGKTRAVVGGLAGKSPEWVKAVETGRLHATPRLPVVHRLSQALGVSVTDLLGDQLPEVEQVGATAHPRLDAVRAALNDYFPAGEEPPSLDSIADRLAVTWRVRHAASDHRTVSARLLPEMIRDARRAVAAHQGDDQRRAYSLYANVLNVAQLFAAWQPDAGLVWRITDTAMSAAQASGDPKAVAMSTWLLTEVLRESGDWSGALSVAESVISRLEPGLGDGDDDLLALWGNLHAAACVTAARAGEQGRALRLWDAADRVAGRLPDGYVHPQTWFSRPLIGFYAVSVGVELRKAGEAIRQAGRAPAEALTSRPRRARYLIEIAKGHYLRRDFGEAVRFLGLAYDAAPETIRFNLDSRRIVSELLKGPGELRREANDLAVKVGLVT